MYPKDTALASKVCLRPPAAGRTDASSDSPERTSEAVRKWLLYSTLFGVFGSRFLVIVGGLALFYFYFVVIINLLLLAAMGHLWVPAKLRWFLGYLFVSGTLGLLLGTNSAPGFVKSLVGIAMCALCSAAMLRYFRFNVVGLFRYYAQFAFYAAIIGLLYLPFQGDRFGRLVGLALEPSVFCLVCMPALYFYADEWQRCRRHGVRLLVLLAAYLLTLSSLGYLGLLFGGLLFGKRYRIGRALVPVVLCTVAIVIYQQSDLFQARLDDTLTGLVAGDVDGINASSFGVVANLLITEQQFADHTLLGGGLGSHIIAHAKYIDQVPGAAYQSEEVHSLGQWDASSLFLRITSEFGLVGLVASAWFLVWFYPRRVTIEEQAISMALLCYIFMKLLRSGEYFGGEQFFFLAIYAVIGMKSRFRAHLEARAHALSIAPADPTTAPGALPATT